MRYQIEFNVTGTNMHDVVEAATKQWQAVSGKSDSLLPTDAEIDAISEADSIVAKVFIRGKW